MFSFMVKKMLPAVKAHALQEYGVDQSKPHSGQHRKNKMRDGYEAEALYFSADRANAPLVIDLYGGGYIGGNIYKQAPLCARYRDTLHVNSAALSYRYGPDHKHPKAIEDVYDGICALIDDSNLDFDRNNIIMEGHSAGAHLVISTMLYAQTQDRPLPVKAMILDYPVFDVRMNSMKKLSKLRYMVAPMVLEMMYYGYFENEAVASRPTASPILAADDALKALPPMYINTCEHDSLKYSAQAFVDRLKSLGIHCEMDEVTDAVHGYVETCSFDSMKDSKEYPEEMKRNQYALYEKTFADLCAFIQSQIKEGGCI